MRATIIGAGPAGLLHAIALRAAGVSIASVFDPDMDRASSLAGILGARVARGFDEVVAGTTEVFVVASPPPVHVAQTLRLARPDRIVLLEKPLALDEAGLASLEHLEGCVPAFQWRFGRALRSVRAAIEWGELGDAPSVAVDLAWRRDDEYFARGRDARGWGCGALLSIGIHAVDAVLFALRDRPTWVAASLAHRDGIDVETGAALTFATAGGAQVSLRLTLDAASDRSRFSFCGNHTTATFEGSEADPTAATVQWDVADSQRRARLRTIEANAPGYTTGPLMVPHVAAAVGRPLARSMELSPPTVRGAASAHRLVFAAYESARIGQVVTIPTGLPRESQRHVRDMAVDEPRQ